MTYYLVSKRDDPASKDDVEKALESYCENTPKVNETEINGLWAIELDGDTAIKLVNDDFSVQICPSSSAQA